MRARSVIAVLAALLLTCVPAASAAAQWHVEAIDPLPSGQSGGFDGLYAASDGTAFAVGHRYGVVGGALEFRTWVQRYDGSNWHRVNSQDTEGAPAGNTLIGVDGTSPTDVWTAGSWWVAGRYHSLIEHWNGSAFTMVTTPDSTYGESLSGISARTTTDAWAVGTATQPGIDYGGSALHWNGTTWKRVDVPMPDGCTSRVELYDVAAVVPGRVLAVGDCNPGNGLPVRALMLRWNGSAWSNAAPALHMPTQAELDEIAFDAPDDVWAVGRDSSDGVDRVLLLHYDGHRWLRVRPGLLGYEDIEAHAVSVRDGQVLITGGASSTNGFGPFAALYDGTHWKREVPGAHGQLFAAAQSPFGNAWGAGSDGLGPSIAERTDQ